MSRLIDADDLPNRKFVGVATWTPTEADSWQRGWNDAIDTIVKVQPTIDAVPVVRCKDCIHLEILNGSTYYAKCRWNGRLFERFGRADTRKWFCADGERRTNERPYQQEKRSLSNIRFADA